MSTLSESALEESQPSPKQIEMQRNLHNGAMLPQLVRTWPEQARQQLRIMRDTIQRRDCHTVTTPAHSFKSASYGIGAKYVGATCAELEGAARGDGLGNTTALFSILQQRFLSVQSELEPNLS